MATKKLKQGIGRIGQPRLVADLTKGRQNAGEAFFFPRQDVTMEHSRSVLAETTSIAALRFFSIWFYATSYRFAFSAVARPSSAAGGIEPFMFGAMERRREWNIITRSVPAS